MGANNQRFEIPGETDLRVLRAKKQGRLARKHLFKLYKDFCDIDKDLSGTIDIDEFHVWLKEPRTLFTVAVFGLTDVDAIDKKLGGHGLNFPEFVSTLSAYCLMGPEDIVRFSYNVVDKEGNGHVDPIALGEMLQALHNDEMNHQDAKGYNALIYGFDDNGNGTIEFGEYRKMHDQYPHLLFPAFRLQQAMKFRTFGDKFWDNRRIRNADNRNAQSNRGNELREKFMEKNLNYKKKLLREDRKHYSAYFLSDSPLYASSYKEERANFPPGGHFLPVLEHNILMITGGPQEKEKPKVKTPVESIETPGEAGDVITPMAKTGNQQESAEASRERRRRRTEARKSSRKASKIIPDMTIAE